MALSQLDDRSGKAGPNINPARVLDRILRFWYIMIVSLAISFTVAYLVNRYTMRIYPVNASIIIRESEENIGAKFLYNNSLINPYRNYYNEFYIMRSYPLMQKVVEDLNLDVSYHVEGEIITTEWYMPHFPVKVRSTKGDALPYGNAYRFRILSEERFELGGKKDADKNLVSYRFNDTILVDGKKLYFEKTEPLKGKFQDIDFTLSFNDPYRLAQHYSSALRLTWAEQNAAVVSLYLQGPVPEKEKDFLVKFIEYYQRYDVEKKTMIATKSIEFLDKQVRNISDSLRYYEEKIARMTLSSQNSIERGIKRMEALGETVDENEIEMRLQERYYAYLEEYMNRGDNFDQILLPSSMGVKDPVLSSLITKLVELQFELRLLNDQIRQNRNPYILENKEKVDLIKGDISEGIRSAKEIMRINRNLYRERLKELENSLENQPEPDKTLANAERNYKLNENLYMFFDPEACRGSHFPGVHHVRYYHCQ